MSSIAKDGQNLNPNNRRKTMGLAHQAKSGKKRPSAQQKQAAEDDGAWEQTEPVPLPPHMYAEGVIEPAFDPIMEYIEEERAKDKKIARLQAQLEQVKQEGEYIQALQQWAEMKPARLPAQSASQPAPAPVKQRARQLDLSQAQQKLLLTIQEAAEMLSMSRAMIYPMVIRGEIASIKVGGKRLIPLSALEQFIRERAGDGETSEASERDRNHRPAQGRTLRGTLAAR